MYMSSVVDRYTKNSFHITKVDYSYEADTYISDFDKLKDWRITGQSDEHTYFDICYEFVRYERKGKADEMPE